MSEDLNESLPTKTITVGTVALEVPAYYQQVRSMPDDPEGSVALMAQTPSAGCFVMLFPITARDAMPFDAAAVIAGVRGSLADDQGIIEVACGMADSGRYIYSLIKTLKTEHGISAGVQYALCMDIERGGQMVHAQGFFDEIGMTGMRDSAVLSMLSRDDPDLMNTWREDPYDPAYTAGALMNRSEDAQFDAQFPAHPLSMARAFIACITGE